MDPHERAISVWYRVAGLASREQRDLAVEIIEAEIRSAQYEVAAGGGQAGANGPAADGDCSSAQGDGGEDGAAEAVAVNV